VYLYWFQPCKTGQLFFSEQCEPCPTFGICDGSAALTCTAGSYLTTQNVMSDTVNIKPICQVCPKVLFPNIPDYPFLDGIHGIINMSSYVLHSCDLRQLPATGGRLFHGLLCALQSRERLGDCVKYGRFNLQSLFVSCRLCCDSEYPRKTAMHILYMRDACMHKAPRHNTSIFYRYHGRPQCVYGNVDIDARHNRWQIASQYLTHSPTASYLRCMPRGLYA